EEGRVMSETSCVARALSIRGPGWKEGAVPSVDRGRCDGVARDRMRLGLGQVLSGLQQWLRNLLAVLLAGADLSVQQTMRTRRLGPARRKKEAVSLTTRSPVRGWWRARSRRGPSCEAPTSGS